MSARAGSPTEAREGAEEASGSRWTMDTVASDSDLEAEVHRVFEGLPGCPLELVGLREDELPPETHMCVSHGFFPPHMPPTQGRTGLRPDVTTKDHRGTLGIHQYPKGGVRTHETKRS